MSTSSISPRQALHTLLRVNETLARVLAERATTPPVTEPEKRPATTRRLRASVAADVCPQCGQEIKTGQLVTSDFQRHISCPEVPAYSSAA